MPRAKKRDEAVSEKKMKKVARKVVEKELDRNIEIKKTEIISNINPGTAATNSSGSIISLSSLITQGDDSAQRIGNKIKIVSYKSRMYLRPQVNYTTDPTYVRAILFRDKTKSATLPTVGDLLNPPVTNLSFLTVEALQSKRFEILYDKLLTLDPLGGAAGTFYTTQTYQSIKRNFKMKNKFAEFTDAGGAYSGQLYYLIISNLPTANSPGITFRDEIQWQDA